MKRDEEGPKVFVDSHSDDGVMMVNIRDPEMREAFEHCAREEGISIEDYLKGILDRKMQEMTELGARQRGITVEQFLEQLDQEPDPDARENEIIKALERGLEGEE